MAVLYICITFRSHPLRLAKRLTSGKTMLYFAKEGLFLREDEIEGLSDDTAKGHGGEEAKLRDDRCDHNKAGATARCSLWQKHKTE